MKPRKGDEDASEVAPATLERWSMMAEKLKSKLQSTQRENERLKDKVERQTTEIKEMRDEKIYQQERIEDLEFQCLEKSSRISTLALILESRSTDEVIESLLQKSLEHAEMSLSVDRLRMALHKCENSNHRLLKEKESLQVANHQMNKKLEESTLVWNEAKKEQQQNRKMLLEMGDVVRTLNCVTVDFESTISPHQHGAYPLENIKRKIHAMEQDRQRLIQECNSLREENDSKHHRIQELEEQSRSWSTTSRTTRSDDEQQATASSVAFSQPSTAAGVDTQTSPISFDTTFLRQEDRSTYIEDATQRMRSVGSNVSSFSELDAPPSEVEGLNDHQQLKDYYEESLERIVRMSAELGNTKADLRDQQIVMEKLREQLDQTTLERDDARREVEEALSLAENAAGKQERMLVVHRDQMQTLQNKYDRLDAEYGQQLEELENQIAEAEEFFKSHCEELKAKHVDTIGSLEREREELKKYHYEEIKAEKDRVDDLNEELDVLMEIHTRTEDDLENLQKKYDEALSTIVELEDRVQTAAKLSGAERAKLEKDVEGKSKLFEEVKAKVDISKQEMQEAVIQQQKLRRENEVVLARHGQLVTQLKVAKQNQIEDKATMKELRDNCCDMEERVQRAELDSSTRFQQLQASYQMAITKIRSLAHQLYQAGIPIEEPTKQDVHGEAVEVGEENLGVHEKIKRLEQELMGRGPAKRTPCGEEADAQKFHHDYTLILKNLARLRTPTHRSNPPQPCWYNRLTHQLMLRAVQTALLKKVHKNVELDLSISFDSLLPDFIHHATKMRRVLKMAIMKVQPPTNVETASIHIPTSHVKDPTIIFAEPGFFEHQRLLTIVHYDIITRAEKCDSSRSSTTYARSWKSEGPEDIGEAKSALLQLKGETQKIKLAASTAKIRYEAREKEHRVLRLQYQKLFEQYNQALKKQEVEGPLEDLPTNDKVKTAINKIQRDVELVNLKTALRNAELKVERMVSELRTTKTRAEHTRKQQEEGEKSLQDLIHYEEQRGGSTDHQLPITTTGQATHTSQAEAIKVLPIVDGTHSSRGIASLDGSRLASDGGFSAGEGCDERGEDQASRCGTMRLEGGFSQLENDHDQAKRTISQLRMLLSDAEHAAEHAKVQLKRREENLRDVIREYNQIKGKSDEIVARNDDQAKKDAETRNDNELAARRVGTETLIRERNVALGKISLLESEVAEARRIAKEAQKKRLERESQLREVIEQYKELNQEHKKTLSVVEELRGALARYEPTRFIEARQRSQESDEQCDDKRDTTPHEPSRGQSTTRLCNRTTTELSGSQQIGQKNATKRKNWFRDLGHQKGARQGNTS